MHLFTVEQEVEVEYSIERSSLVFGNVLKYSTYLGSIKLGGRVEKWHILYSCEAAS